MGEVVHIAKATGIGGSERHLIDLLPGLREAGVPVRLHLLEEPARPVDELVEALGALNVSITRGAIRGPCDPLAAAHIARTVRTAAIMHTHLVHADLHGGAAVAAMGSRGPAHIFSIHSERHEDGRLTSLAMRRVARRAKVCIAISEITGETARSRFGVGPERLAVIPYGVRIPSDAHRVPGNRFRLVVHSRLAPKKHIDHVVRAFGRAAIPDGRLTIVGEGEHRSVIEEAIRSTNLRSSVELLGELSNVWPQLCAADVWISLSSTEGFGLALAEALGIGLACICTDIPAHRAVARDSALFVPPGDEAAATAAIRRLHENPGLREEMAQRGRHRAAELSVKKMVERTAAVYEQGYRCARRPGR